ncbi:Uncharacterised protein [Vibrio cholerae]|nr:Uncharacterised protein [Vibrio cholerae]
MQNRIVLTLTNIDLNFKNIFIPILALCHSHRRKRTIGLSVLIAFARALLVSSVQHLSQQVMCCKMQNKRCVSAEFAAMPPAVF